MNAEDPEDTRDYFVVVNDEEQYSIWLAHLQVPDGWKVVGEAQPKSACLDVIERLWTDMRPASLRRFMEDQARERAGVSSESD